MSERFRLDLRYFVTVLLSWLIPGAGHWLLGYRIRGALLGATLLGMFWFGEAVLAERLAVTWKVHPVFFGLQVGNGLSALLADWLWGEPLDPDAGQIDSINVALPRHLNLGILFTSSSGLLNLLVLLHILDPRTWKEAAPRREKRQAPT